MLSVAGRRLSHAARAAPAQRRLPAHWHGGATVRCCSAATTAQPGPSKDSGISRLPSDLCTPSEEFPFAKKTSFRFWWLTRKRLLSRAMKRVCNQQTAVVLGASTTLVLGSGLLEGALLCVDPLQHLQFVWKYGVDSMLPSLIWDSRNPHLVCHALGLDARDVLRTFGSSPADSEALMHAQSCKVVRSLTSSFMLLAHLVAVTESTIKAAARYRYLVRQGEQPPLNGTKECVLRFCGRESDTTELALRRYRNHVFPIFDSAEHVKHIVWRQRQIQDSHIPVFWHIDRSRITEAYSWERLQLSSNFLMHTKAGQSLLYMEADCTNSDDILSSVETDLTFKEASLSFRMAEKYAMMAEEQRSGLRRVIKGKQVQQAAFDPFRVFLGDSLQQYTTGGGHKVKLRDLVKQTHEVDVVIDSKAPVVVAVLKWLNSLDAIAADMKASREAKRLKAEAEKAAQEERDDAAAVKRMAAEAAAKAEAAEAAAEAASEAKADAQDEAEAGAEAAEAAGKGSAEAVEEDEDDDLSTLDAKEAVAGLDAEATAGPVYTPVIAELSDDACSVVEMLTPPKKEVGHTSTEDYVKDKVVCLHTSSAQYFAELSTILAGFGFTAVDSSLVSGDAARALPRLIYFPTTADTVHAASTLMRAGGIHPGLCCAVLDKSQGYRELRSMADEHGMQVVCSSVIHDDMLRQVRMWVRMGFSASQIQAEVDKRFEVVMKSRSDVVNGQPAEK